MKLSAALFAAPLVATVGGLFGLASAEIQRHPALNFEDKDNLFENFAIENDYKDSLNAQIDHFINGADFECESGPNVLFFDSLLSPLSPTELADFEYLFQFLDVSFWIEVAVVLFGATGGSFYPGFKQGKEYQKGMKSLNKFWGLDSIRLQSFSMHIMKEEDLMIQVLRSFFEVPTDEIAAALVREVNAILEAMPAIGYNFPLWTVNAFAYPDSPQGVGGIALGEGLAQYLVDDRGFGDVGPDWILYHEFAHHVLFDLEFVFRLPPAPENTRYIELLTDSLAAYYAHHPRGASLQTKRIVQVVEVAFDGGDCGFSSFNHHGTPNQRAKAVQFAVDLIDGNKKKGHIMSAQTFVGLFDAAFDAIIVAPDAN